MSPDELDAMADRHDAGSICTEPARSNFAAVCRDLAAAKRGGLNARAIEDPDLVLPWLEDL